MDPHSASVRHFASLAEISALPCFEPDAPMRVEDYSGLVGWYRFEGLPVRCCLLKPNGNSCQKPHGTGWLARRADGVITVIGGDCAKEKFAAANSAGLIDIRRAENEIERASREAKLQELLADRDAQMERVEAEFRRLEQLEAALAGLAKAVGPRVWASLELAGRSGTDRIAVRGYTPAKRDADGDVITPRIDVQVVAGRIPGLRLCAPNLVRTVRHGLAALRLRCTQALPPEGPRRGPAVKELIAALRDVLRQIESARALNREGDALAEADLTPITVLERDVSARVKLLQYAQARMGVTMSRAEAKDWIRANDARLAEAHGVTTLGL